MSINLFSLPFPDLSLIDCSLFADTNCSHTVFPGRNHLKTKNDMPQPKTVAGLHAPSPVATLPVTGPAAVGWAFCLIGSLAALLAPALWNGYAVTFYDTGGYVDAALGMKLVPGRSLLYGLFLQAGSLGWQSFWGPVLVQALATLWLIRLLLRCHRLPAGPRALAMFSAALACLTGISWYVGQLQPDILIPLTVVALWLLGFHWPALSRLERAGLAILTLLGLLSHMSCLALALGLIAVILAARVLGRRWIPTVWIGPPLAVVLAGLLLMPLLHLTLTGKAGYTPGGPTFLFGRLVQDGVAQRWLAEHCPVPGIKLCALHHRLPATADDFLWNGGSPFQDLGGWKGAEPELKWLTRTAVTAYPGMTLWTTVRSTAQQMVKVATGDALHESHSDTRGIIHTFLPAIAQPFFAARQQNGQFTGELFDRMNLIHVPVALLSTFSLLPMALWCSRNGRRDLAALALFVFLALLGNAFICGALSNPHDRYQSRLVWLAPLVVGMALVACQERRMKRQPDRTA
jgi:hypothetical protein